MASSFCISLLAFAARPSNKHLKGVKYKAAEERKCWLKAKLVKAA